MSAFHVTPKMIAMEAARLLSARLTVELGDVARNTRAGLLACAGDDGLLLTIKYEGGTVEQEIYPDDLLLSLDDFSARYIDPAVPGLLWRLQREPANEDR